MKRLRDTPTTTGHPSATSRGSSRSTASECSLRLANPNARIERDRVRGDAGALGGSRAAIELASTSPSTSSPYTACSYVAMSLTPPRECMRMTPAPARAHTAAMPHVEAERRRRRSRCRRPRRAPRRATSAFTVSTESDRLRDSAARSAAMTGIDAPHLLVGVHRLRVLRPRRLAADVEDVRALGEQRSPCSTRGLVGEKKRPPSLKLSGVTLRMPRMTGRSSRASAPRAATSLRADGANRPPPAHAGATSGPRAAAGSWARRGFGDRRGRRAARPAGVPSADAAAASRRARATHISSPVSVSRSSSARRDRVQQVEVLASASPSRGRTPR